MPKKYFSLEKIFYTNPGQLNLAPLVFFVGIMIFSLAIAVNIQKFSPLMVLAVVAGLIVAVITLVNTNFALIILVFSMMLSPEIPIAGTPERAVTIRVDDFLIMAVFFTWLGKMAVLRQTGFIRRTPINKLIYAYVGAHIFSTVLGIMGGWVNVKSSIFYILKYIEYFMVYLLFVNNFHDLKQVKMFLTYFLITAFIAGLYGSSQIGSISRVTAPFEGEHAEPNTFGGYLMFTMAITAGLFLYSPFSLRKLLLGGLFCANIPPFLMTLSRSSYMGLSVAMVFLALFTRKNKAFLIALLIFLVLFLPLVTPAVVKKRIAYTFESKKTVEIGGSRIALESSAAARVEDVSIVFSKLNQKPFFGYGVTGLGLIDPQYLRYLGELGFVGFFMAMWLFFSMIINSWRIFSTSVDDFSGGLALGFLAGLLGLMIMGVGASVFVIVRISEPLWFVTACVMSLPELQNESAIE
ncbi:MAG: O-antigen ligase family protein [Candidatus Omnitrophota bacterium]|nr:O-antigen ligase family protein [Candidatus Omnitrophota bacterium]